MSAVSDKVKPCLWFNGQAEAAAKFYVSLFADSEIVSVSSYMVEFRLAGRRMQALNGGPEYTLNEAFSLSISCADADEVDRYWSALTADGGRESRCGWLKDRFGVSWQVVPEGLGAVLGDADPVRAGRAIQAMMGMRKLDLAAMRSAADG